MYSGDIAFRIPAVPNPAGPVNVAVPAGSQTASGMMTFRPERPRDAMSLGALPGCPSISKPCQFNFVSSTRVFEYLTPCSAPSSMYWRFVLEQTSQKRQRAIVISSLDWLKPRVCAVMFDGTYISPGQPHSRLTLPTPERLVVKDSISARAAVRGHFATRASTVNAFRPRIRILHALFRTTHVRRQGDRLYTGKFCGHTT